MVCILIGLR